MVPWVVDEIIRILIDDFWDGPAINCTPKFISFYAAECIYAIFSVDRVFHGTNRTFVVH